MRLESPAALNANSNVVLAGALLTILLPRTRGQNDFAYVIGLQTVTFFRSEHRPFSRRTWSGLALHYMLHEPCSSRLSASVTRPRCIISGTHRLVDISTLVEQLLYIGFCAGSPNVVSLVAVVHSMET